MIILNPKPEISRAFGHGKAQRLKIVLSEVPILYKHFPISFVVSKVEGDRLVKDINIFYKIEKDNGYCTYLDPNVGCTLGQEKPYLANSTLSQ